MHREVVREQPVQRSRGRAPKELKEGGMAGEEGGEGAW